MTRPARWARSPLDYHAYLLLPVRWSADQPSGHCVGARGHPVPGDPTSHIGPCDDCDPSAT
ncbi:MAG: hypothetical protein ACRDRW_21905 [Pseudonocardiaceae bacterium]